MSHTCSYMLASYQINRVGGGAGGVPHPSSCHIMAAQNMIEGIVLGLFARVWVCIDSFESFHLSAEWQSLTLVSHNLLSILAMWRIKESAEQFTYTFNYQLWRVFVLFFVLRDKSINLLLRHDLCTCHALRWFIKWSMTIKVSMTKGEIETVFQHMPSYTMHQQTMFQMKCISGLQETASENDNGKQHDTVLRIRKIEMVSTGNPSSHDRRVCDVKSRIAFLRQPDNAVINHWMLYLFRKSAKMPLIAQCVRCSCPDMNVSLQTHFLPFPMESGTIRRNGAQAHFLQLWFTLLDILIIMKFPHFVALKLSKSLLNVFVVTEWCFGKNGEFRYVLKITNVYMLITISFCRNYIMHWWILPILRMYQRHSTGMMNVLVTKSHSWILQTNVNQDTLSMQKEIPGRSRCCMGEICWIEDWRCIFDPKGKNNDIGKETPKWWLIMMHAPGNYLEITLISCAQCKYE